MKFYLIWDTEKARYVGPSRSPMVYTTIGYCRSACRSLNWIETPYDNGQPRMVYVDGAYRQNPEYRSYSQDERIQMTNRRYIIHQFHDTTPTVLPVVDKEA
jgi:hypothetical protein